MQTITYNPETHVIVPREPSEEMMQAATADSCWEDMNPPPSVAYRSMLAAAPQPEPNHNWCAGCSPDNCSGCGAEPVESEPAVNECRLTLIHQIHELADHIERAAPSVTDSDTRKQMLGQREYALKVSAKWNMNGNPFSPQPDRVAELEAALKVARDAIDALQNGLKWYQDAYPDSISEADHEEIAKVDAAIAKINEVLYD